MDLKLPLYLHNSHLCDPDFKDDHTYVIKKISKRGEILAVCSGCGLEWNGSFRLHWVPDGVALALKSYCPGISLKRSRLKTGYVFDVDKK